MLVYSFQKIPKTVKVLNLRSKSVYSLYPIKVHILNLPMENICEFPAVEKLFHPWTV